VARRKNPLLLRHLHLSLLPHLQPLKQHLLLLPLKQHPLRLPLTPLPLLLPSNSCELIKKATSGWLFCWRRNFDPMIEPHFA
jgi:hypothetical protein